MLCFRTCCACCACGACGACCAWSGSRQYHSEEDSSPPLQALCVEVSDSRAWMLRPCPEIGWPPRRRHGRGFRLAACGPQQCVAGNASSLELLPRWSVSQTAICTFRQALLCLIFRDRAFGCSSPSCLRRHPSQVISLSTVAIVLCEHSASACGVHSRRSSVRVITTQTSLTSPSNRCAWRCSTSESWLWFVDSRRDPFRSALR